MSALSAARSVTNKGTVLQVLGYKAAASQMFYHGGLVAVNAAGYLVPAAATAGLRVCGIADLQGASSLMSSATLGATVVSVQTGIFPMVNGLTTDAATIADLLNDVYVLDDQTISRLPGAGRPVAGQLLKIVGSDYFIGIGFDLAHASNAAGAGTAYQGRGSVEAGVASGAISVNTEITTLNLATGAQALTLANGLFIGQRKTIVVVGSTGSPVGTLTPATPSGFATVTVIGAIGDTVELIWAGAGAWYLASSFGVTFT